MSRSFELLATVTIDIYRIPITDGKHGTAAKHISSLSVTPLVTAERYFSQAHTNQRPELHSPYQDTMFMLQGAYDITKKDLVKTSDGIMHNLQHVENWTLPGTSEKRMLLIIQQDST